MLSVELLVSLCGVPLHLNLWGDVELGEGGDEEERLEKETMVVCLSETASLPMWRGYPSALDVRGLP